MKLTPEDQSKLRDEELAKIIRKLNGGMTLSRGGGVRDKWRLGTPEFSEAAFPGSEGYTLGAEEWASMTPRTIRKTLARMKRVSFQPPRYCGREADWQKAKVARDVE